MFLHKVPAIRVPQPVIYAAAIFLGTFYFWFTRPAEESRARPRRRLRRRFEAGQAVPGDKAGHA
ncbi:hypothetical protein [Alicyclobacillus kakegawensis]|uniref:hypothetical protein n=1 Tax=Alicyclobacillus kakegawensis TaxID=392012 RepID=UPI00082A75B2|nr:hypothetical protein [Alicyclobacillus kakegawensis]